MLNKNNNLILKSKQRIFNYNRIWSNRELANKKFKKNPNIIK